eukprot:g3606.t1
MSDVDQLERKRKDVTEKSDAQESKPKTKKRRRRKKKASNPQKGADDGGRNAEEAVEYLELWTNDRMKWKFKKAKQSWLLRNMFDPKMVSKRTFGLLLPYLMGLQGAARSRCYARAKTLREEYSGKVVAMESAPKKDDENETKEGKTRAAAELKAVKKIYIRSKKIVKLLVPAELPAAGASAS